MFKIKKISIKNYMVVLIVFFVIFTILTNVFFLRTINKISINSNLYLNIKSSSDLKADILPPKLYIIESYLLVQQMAIEKDASKNMKLLENFKKSRDEYFIYYDFWKNNIKDKQIEKLLIVSSHVYVKEFYKIFDKKFIPALNNNDTHTLHELANIDMKKIFELHRNIIDNVSKIIEASNLNIEKNAKNVVSQSQILLVMVYIISIVFILVISYMIFKNVTKIEKNILSSQHETEMANKRMEIIIDGLKKFKHSYNNTLASLKGYLLENDIKGLSSYLEEIIVEKNKIEKENYLKLDLIQNPAITGLIISKLIYTERLGIEFNIKIKGELKEISIKTSHLCEILGILIDNAIEAAYESDDKIVNLKINNSEEALIFEIQNSLSDLPDKIKMFEKGWSTKGENRGLGLWIVKDIMSKYENVVLNSIIDVKIVRQELIILKKIQQ